jgi:hypothetical protein
MSADPRRRRRYRREPVAISDRVGRFRRGPSAPAGDLAALQAAWLQVVGPEIAARTTVTRRSRAGVVTVACADSLWAHDLHSRVDVLADQLAETAPGVAITGVRFVTADRAVPETQPQERARAVRPTDEELAAAAASVGEVSDPDLRELLTRAAAGQMALTRLSRKSLQNAANEGRADRGD